MQPAAAAPDWLAPSLRRPSERRATTRFGHSATVTARRGSGGTLNEPSVFFVPDAPGSSRSHTCGGVPALTTTCHAELFQEDRQVTHRSRQATRSSFVEVYHRPNSLSTPTFTAIAKASKLKFRFAAAVDASNENQADRRRQQAANGAHDERREEAMTRERARQHNQRRTEIANKQQRARCIRIFLCESNGRILYIQQAHAFLGNSLSLPPPHGGRLRDAGRLQQATCHQPCAPDTHLIFREHPPCFRAVCRWNVRQSPATSGESRPVAPTALPGMSWINNRNSPQ